MLNQDLGANIRSKLIEPLKKFKEQNVESQIQEDFSFEWVDIIKVLWKLVMSAGVGVTHDGTWKQHAIRSMCLYVGGVHRFNQMLVERTRLSMKR